MKVYYVYPDDYSWDEYTAIVVVAENEDRALELAKHGNWGECYFNKYQGEIHVEEVDLTTESVVLESFHAG